MGQFTPQNATANIIASLEQSCHQACNVLVCGVGEVSSLSNIYSDQNIKFLVLVYGEIVNKAVVNSSSSESGLRTIQLSHVAIRRASAFDGYRIAGLICLFSRRRLHDIQHIFLLEVLSQSDSSYYILHCLLQLGRMCRHFDSSEWPCGRRYFSAMPVSSLCNTNVILPVQDLCAHLLMYNLGFHSRTYSGHWLWPWTSTL